MQKTDNIFFRRYAKYFKPLQKELNHLYCYSKDKKKGELYKIACTTIRDGGKLLRSLLTLLSCEVICGDYKPALPIAVAYELAHNASLIQDDILDNSPLRRGKASVNFRYGTNTAILLSDIFIFQIFNMIAKYQRTNLSKERICQILEIVGNCGKEIAIGEYLNDRFTGKIDLSEEDYFLLISLKTGKLFAAPSACGAIAANGQKKEVESMYKIGEKIGVAFQIYDDLLDIIGQKQVIGKPTLNDIKNGQQNIMISHAFRNSSLKSKKFIKEIFGKKILTLRQKKRIKDILEKTGSVIYAEKKCKDFITEVKKDLDGVKDDYRPVKEKILDVVQFVITRNI